MTRFRVSIVLIIFLALLIGGQRYLVMKQSREPVNNQDPEVVDRPASGPGNPVPVPLHADSAPVGHGSESIGAAKWQSLEQAMATDDHGLTVHQNADGSRSIDLAGRFTHVSAAVRGPDGRLRLQCFTDFQAMDASLTGQLPAPQVIPHSHETVPY